MPLKSIAKKLLRFKTKTQQTTAFCYTWEEDGFPSHSRFRCLQLLLGDCWSLGIQTWVTLQMKPERSAGLTPAWRAQFQAPHCLNSCWGHMFLEWVLVSITSCGRAACAAAVQLPLQGCHAEEVRHARYDLGKLTAAVWTQMWRRSWGDGDSPALTELKPTPALYWVLKPWSW